MGLKVYSFKAEKELLDVIEFIAQENKTSKSAVIRQALNAYIFDYWVKRTQHRKEPKKLRVIE
jgi:predicted transcriptional regulator